MDQKLKNRLTDAGVDLERTLYRFLNNEPMYEKFLMRFPQDENYIQLEQAIQNGDMRDMERPAHTLKGVSANLGLDSLASLLNQMVMRIRRGEDTPETLMPLFQEIQAEYQKLCSILKENP